MLVVSGGRISVLDQEVGWHHPGGLVLFGSHHGHRFGHCNLHALHHVHQVQGMLVDGLVFGVSLSQAAGDEPFPRGSSAVAVVAASSPGGDGATCSGGSWAPPGPAAPCLQCLQALGVLSGS